MVLDVATIIVLYHTELEFLSMLKDLCLEKTHIILISNGISKELLEKLKTIQLKHKRQLHIHLNSDNIGLASAQNQGIEIAKTIGCKYILFLDDDSHLSKGAIDSLKSFLIEDPKCGIVGPDIVHTSGAKQSYWVKSKFFWQRRSFTSEETSLREVNTIIASGSMIPIHIIQSCGLFEDRYFIDYIDIEYCLRVRKAGYRVSVVKNVQLRHQLGEKSISRFFFFEVSPTNHSSLRKFFMTRNRIWTWIKYARILPDWFFLDLINFCVDTTRTLLFETGREKKIKAFCLGILYGLTRTEHSIPESLQ
ncbi:dTDP-rhamnosyl transferase rfbF [Leptospira ryugenii]|uniref:dTDP-rhamnosyl transferase rfbF n=1 Tax=Leptospira ryugenii TaxID=1917863 RepID=A0A2P2DW77_9LEPT|nr:glycosyltransferase [Leptospira ryugenii]GBF48857.1 dTDP-rhamnosyl transferase rfbF [Leptospira ryugenii]